MTTADSYNQITAPAVFFFYVFSTKKERVLNIFLEQILQQWL